MASLNKQQKRAKRAKIKAKQINIHGRKPVEQDEELDNELGDELGEIGEPIPEYTLAMFSKMRDAEAISRNEMLVTLLSNLADIISDQPELLDMENADNEAMAATHLAADMLIDYRMWADGMDRDLPDEVREQIGDAQVIWSVHGADGRQLALRVPSAVARGEFNVLVNPAHPQFGQIRLLADDPLALDPRLFGG